MTISSHRSRIVVDGDLRVWEAHLPIRTEPKSTRRVPRAPKTAGPIVCRGNGNVLRDTTILESKGQLKQQDGSVRVWHSLPLLHYQEGLFENGGGLWMALHGNAWPISSKYTLFHQNTPTKQESRTSTNALDIAEFDKKIGIIDTTKKKKTHDIPVRLMTLFYFLNHFLTTFNK